VGALNKIMTKSGSEVSRRVLHLGDQSGAKIELTIWGEKAEMFNANEMGVLAVKSVKVSDFNGCSLSALRSSMYTLNPDIPPVHRLQEWFDKQGHSITWEELSTKDHRKDPNRTKGYDTVQKTFSQIKEEGLGRGETAYFQVKGTITAIKHNPQTPPWYNACPTPSCNKKVTPVEGTGQWLCANCNEHKDSYVPRYILSVTANDHTGSSWLTCFDEVAAELLSQTPAHTLNQYILDQNLVEFEEVFQRALFKSYVLRIRAAERKWDDETRIKCNILNATSIDYITESKHLVEIINKYGEF